MLRHQVEESAQRAPPRLDEIPLRNRRQDCGKKPSLHYRSQQVALSALLGRVAQPVKDMKRKWVTSQSNCRDGHPVLLKEWRMWRVDALYLLSTFFWAEAKAQLCRRISEAGSRGRRRSRCSVDKRTFCNAGGKDNNNKNVRDWMQCGCLRSIPFPCILGVQL